MVEQKSIFAAFWRDSGMNVSAEDGAKAIIIADTQSARIHRPWLAALRFLGLLAVSVLLWILVALGLWNLVDALW